MSVLIPQFEGLRVLIAGDLMLDRYWHGATRRISPEAPVPVVHVGEVEERPGGGANVALNVAALGASATVLGVTGADEAADRLETLLAERGVDVRLERVAGCATITKLRIISKHQQLIRLDFEDGFNNITGNPLAAPFQDALDDASVVVLSDYGKGTLRNPQSLIEAARSVGCPVVVDPKGNDFSRYAGATLITPNEAEFEAVVGACADDQELVNRGRTLLERIGVEHLLVTRGDRGMTLIPANAEPAHLPARAREVFDVTGAGDTVVALMAAGIAAGLELPAAAGIANLGAGVVVGKLGTATVSPAELRQAQRDADGGHGGVVDRAALHDLVLQARQQGERIVMTNGCFDLLHAGHIHYLEAARALGDRLIVAVNDDASVRRLKGDSRPVVPQSQRMAVLAALAAVDWVVPFSEDTPEALITELLPDVLVKGGDYRPDQIAGAQAVLDHGGRVEVVPFQEGLSSSDLIERIRRNTEH